MFNIALWTCLWVWICYVIEICQGSECQWYTRFLICVSMLLSNARMNHVIHPLSSADISVFSSEISKFCYIKKYRYRLHFGTWFLILLTFFEFLKIVLIKMAVILMMSANLATIDLLKIKLFWNEGYDVIISVYDVTNKILSSDSNYFVDMVMWPKSALTLAFPWENL